jgi:hypothetical protein
MRRLLLVLCILLAVASSSKTTAATFVVTTCGSFGSGSLDAALNAANASAGGIITFAVDCSATSPIVLADQVVTKPVTIIGNGASRTTVQPMYELLVTGAGVLAMTGVTTSFGSINFHDTGSGTITNSVFVGSTNGFNARAVYTYGAASASIVGDTFVNAGITNEATGPLTVASSAFSGDHVGIGNITDRSSGMVMIAGSTFTDLYWGVYNQGSGTVTITTSTFSGHAEAGVYNYMGTMMVDNSTVSVDQDTPATGAMGIDNAGPGTMTIRNTIISANIPQSLACVGAISDGGHNLSYGMNQPDFSCPATFLRNQGPRLGALSSNGGNTQTFPLLAGSPAIDSGGSTCPAIDQRGIPRPQGSACDIGAFEVAVVSAVPAGRAGPLLSNQPPPPIPTGRSTGNVIGIPAALPPSR